MLCTLIFWPKQELDDILVLAIDGCYSQDVSLFLAIDSLDLQFIPTHPYEHLYRGETIIGDCIVESVKAFEILN